jgi:hypothetical protein
MQRSTWSRKDESQEVPEAQPRPSAKPGKTAISKAEAAKAAIAVGVLGTNPQQFFQGLREVASGAPLVFSQPGRGGVFLPTCTSRMNSSGSGKNRLIPGLSSKLDGLCLISGPMLLGPLTGGLILCVTGT